MIKTLIFLLSDLEHFDCSLFRVRKTHHPQPINIYGCRIKCNFIVKICLKFPRTFVDRWSKLLLFSFPCATKLESKLYLSFCEQTIVIEIHQNYHENPFLSRSKGNLKMKKSLTKAKCYHFIGKNYQHVNVNRSSYLATGRATLTKGIRTIFKEVPQICVILSIALRNRFESWILKNIYYSGVSEREYSAIIAN